MTKRRWWPTASEIADDLRRELAAGDEDMALRLLMDGINQLPDAAKAGQLDDALAEPEPIGDPRWDTLLAASVRYRLHSIGATPPKWTHKEPLPKFWWPTRINASQQYNDMAHTPAELMRVGIFMDEKDFTTA